MLKLSSYTKSSNHINCWSCTWHYCVSCCCWCICSTCWLRCILASSVCSTNISRSIFTYSWWCWWFWTNLMTYNNSISNNYSKCSTIIRSTWSYSSSIFLNWKRVTCTSCNTIRWPIDCFFCCWGSRWSSSRC